MSRYFPNCINSFFATIIDPKPASVTIYFWDIRQGTEQGGHISMQVGDLYFSAWASTSPDKRKNGEPADLEVISSFEDDLLIVGGRVHTYRCGKRKKSNDPNSVDLLSAPETLKGIEQLTEKQKKYLKNLGGPSGKIQLNSLNTLVMQNFLRSVKNNSNQFSWDRKGVGKDTFNCATFIWEALKKGGIQNLLASYGKTFVCMGLYSSILFPSLYGSWRFVLTLFAIGGMLNAQSSVNALYKLLNADLPNSCVTALTKTVLWVSATFLSGVVSAMTLGRYDDVLKSIFITPDIVWDFVSRAKQSEMTSYTLAPPKQNQLDEGDHNFVISASTGK